MKRVLAGLFLLGLSAAGVYGYTLSERERTYRQQIADGDAALARDNTGAAIEAFSGAITLKDDSMLGYLKRGQTYRRRGEFAAAIRDLRRASEIDPSATRPLEELGDAYLADTPAPLWLRRRPLRGLRQARQPRAARPLQAGVRALQRRPRRPRRSTRCSGRSRSTTGSRRPTTCSGSASATRSIPTWRARARDSRSSCSPALLQAREELADLYGALGGPTIG